MPQPVPADLIRARFSDALSAMYGCEVPLYAQLLELVHDVNGRAMAADPALGAMVEAAGGLAAFNREPHGAIRVGKPDELAALRRVFAVMGMYPVGYYDLSVAGVPVHSTAFRPVDRASLGVNPLRIFCSLLRLELIEDEDLRATAADLLASREILTPRAHELVARAEAEGGLVEEEVDTFVAEVLETFRWREKARVTAATYRRLLGAHRLVADIVAFQGPHINHLTPRTLDIDAAQAEMVARAIKAKAVIEGPPRRHVDILLRQTSFQALEEEITFLGADGGPEEKGSHMARFGEIEQRGAALTPKGRALYDALLDEARGLEGSSGGDYAARLAALFERFPDDLDTLRREGLAYFDYALSAQGHDALASGHRVPADLEACIAAGLVSATPMVYEDFLPVSAAGIFQSNLGLEERGAYAGHSSQAAFEEALGARVADPFALYAALEAQARDAVLARLHGARA
ncbi:VOC family protein [Novosphingobium profundi]|uniref:2-oxoadipate dioxygenase/decarboxylase HglS n=1 Tax=Novosphingobium profundi TaxID=1774954 RepID=UPI001BDA579B|nr:VOC family protein [Novosphingobium profundi]MBT0669217.1 VOC family protein [Novosphingobium profundi]